MKKFFMMACAVCLAMSANAKNVTDGIESTNAEVSAQTEANARLNVGTLEYNEVEGGFGLGMNLSIKHIVFDFAMTYGDTGGYETKGWSVGLGGAYRHWLNKTFYIEGQGGLAFYNSKTEHKGQKVSSGSDFGVFLTPRIGAKIGKNWGFTAGYRWDFPDFKFDNIGDRGHFTVGFSWII